MSQQIDDSTTELMGEAERRRALFMSRLAACGNSRSLLAQELGITRRSVNARLEAYGEKGCAVPPDADISSEALASIKDAFSCDEKLRRRAHFLKVLESCGYNREATARVLKVCLRTVTSLIRQYRFEGVHIPSSQRQGAPLTREQLTEFYAVHASNGFNRTKTAEELSLTMGQVNLRVRYCRALGLKIGDRRKLDAVE